MYLYLFFRPGMRSGPSVILMALAVADTLALISGLIGPYMLKTHGMKIRDYFFICKIYRFIRYSSNYIANWLIVVFTIFRVIAVHLPHKANIYCTRARACIAVIVTSIVCCLFHLDGMIHIDHSSLYNREGKFVRYRCWFNGSRFTYYTYYVQWEVLTVMSLAPFVALIAGNSMIIYKIIIHNFVRRRMSQNNSSNDSQSMTAMLICISLLFFITQVPQIIVALLKRKLNNSPHTPEYLQGFIVIETICTLLKFSNNAVNFFCYCISGRKFRQELVKVLKCSGKSKDVNQVSIYHLSHKTTSSIVNDK